MAKPPKKPKDEDIEVAPDAWERFERAIDKVTQKPKQRDKSKPKHAPSRQGRTSDLE